MREPVRLHKKTTENNVSPLFISSRLFLHPAAIILTLLLGIIILSSIAFALSGGSAVESGSMRNFLVNGV